MISRLMIVALGAVAGAAWVVSKSLSRAREQRAGGQDISRWQGEGGNVPIVDTENPQTAVEALEPKSVGSMQTSP